MENENFFSHFDVGLHCDTQALSSWGTQGLL